MVINMDNYVIGDKEYSREELLVFGKSHYPNFYWIKRGIGILLMFVGFLTATSLVGTGVGLQLGLSDPNAAQYSALALYISAGICFIFGIVGVIIFAVSFKPLPDESYIKHAVDYYTKLDAEQKKKEIRKAQKEEKDEINQLIKYKKLLDAGVITQEEYDAKKKELL